ncbi:STAS domain-containing protein [Nucisporomicrobium flavum]|jgi:anti-sigma B factor antagonist|uniref:STAS domain-containing protein n=1 Tax=Nucisporomicrobium flavum TaxID=2785915 RepID=UPI0018F63215|nr:STAS domain-containing protein [Nucisporomicrobium flavum]
MSAVQVEVTGELDLATAPDLLERVRTTLAGRPDAIVLDLTGVTFCDSSGINALMDAHTLADAGGATLRVANPQRITRRALEVTGVLPLLTGP